MWQRLESLKFWSSMKEMEDGDDDDPKESLEEALAELGVESDKESDKADEALSTETTIEVYKTCIGEITNVKDALIVIDEEYCVTRGESNFRLQIGQKVEYTLIGDGQNGWKATKVVPWERDTWSMNETEETSPGDLSNKVKENRGIPCIVICQVLKKEKGMLTLMSETMDKFDVNIEQVSTDFIPMKGDRLSCEVLTELREDSPNLMGNTVVVKKMRALRSKVCVAEVTLWKASLGAGIINREIAFTSDACSAGYVPHLGDKVVTECIESEQGGLSWRAVSVSPESVAEIDNNCQQTSRRTNNSVPQNSLYHPKGGVEVTLLSENLSFKMGSTRNLEVEVKNSSSEAHSLTNYKMRTIGSKSQIVIMNGPNLPYELEPGSEFVFSLTATASCMGRSDESLVLSFDDKFHIGCYISISVDDDMVLNLKATASTRISDKKLNKFDGGSIVPTKNGLICPGIKPIKPPPFIPVQSAQFLPPDMYYSAILDNREMLRKLGDAEEELEKVCPELFEPLNKKNYGQRFHALLYLEEVNVAIKMRQFYQERAIFIPNGEYFTLEVPRLCEARPSLIIGDRAFARNLDISQTEYEGFIHKTHQNEVWLKFGAAFDDVARGNSFEVRFVHSRSTFQKSHQAIEIFCKKDHLGLDWLFPTSLTNKSPQVIITEASDPSPDNHSNKTEVKICNNNSDETVRKNGSPKSSPRLDKLLSLLKEDDALSANQNTRTLSSGQMNCENYSKETPTPTPSGVDRSSAPNGSESSRGSPCSSKETVCNESKTNNVTSNLKPSSLDSAYSHYNNSVKIRQNGDKINWASSGRGYGDPKAQKNVIKSCQVLTHDKIRWFNPALNNRQKEAVKNVLKGEVRPLPYIIHGPPGTGKTVTMVETILQILSLIPDSRLLIATPSNSAADLITERILLSFGLLPGQIVRLVSFSYWNDGRVPAHLRPYAAIADLKENPDKTETPGANGIKICSRDALGRHRVTVGTCTSIGIMYTLGFPAGHFTHVFVDEAGQATESEILIPLAFLHQANGQAILAGDPMQLGPVVTSQLAIRFGLGQSLLYRLVSRYPYIRDLDRFPDTGGNDPRLVTKLLDNYRSIPELLRFTSDRFYDSELIPHVEPENTVEGEILVKMAGDVPVSINNDKRAASLVFHGVRGDNLQEVDSPSWFNPQEVVQVLIYLKMMYAKGFTEDHIGIITPYQKQASKIRQFINDFNLPMPKVGSVEEFQGQERHIIIVSVVRSKEELQHFEAEQALGFLRNPFRVNVATSRARALLLVIGNPHLLGFDVYWRNVIEYAAQIGGYVGCNFPENLSPLTS